jgi:hypothetical protein
MIFVTGSNDLFNTDLEDEKIEQFQTFALRSSDVTAARKIQFGAITASICQENIRRLRDFWS